jgi:hypothetical protein
MPGPPSYYSNHTLPPPPLYPMWGQPGTQTAGMQVWSPSAYPLWQPAEAWHWQPFPAVIYLYKIRGYEIFIHINNPSLLLVM